MDRMTKILLSLIAIALWAILIRLLLPAPLVSQRQLPPTILEAKEGIPYLVASNGHISIWYLNSQSDKVFARKNMTEEDVEKNTILIQADTHPLPSR